VKVATWARKVVGQDPGPGPGPSPATAPTATVPAGVTLNVSAGPPTAGRRRAAVTVSRAQAAVGQQLAKVTVTDG
jgi:hypothetical protein